MHDVKGHGLGLYIVQQLVNSIKGTIQLETTVPGLPEPERNGEMMVMWPSHIGDGDGECVRPTVVEESLAGGVDEGAVGVGDDAARGRACGDLVADRIALVVGGVEIACDHACFGIGGGDDGCGDRRLVVPVLLMPPDDPQQRPGDRIAGCRGVAATEQRKAEQCQETECGTERGATQ